MEGRLAHCQASHGVSNSCMIVLPGATLPDDSSTVSSGTLRWSTGDGVVGVDAAGLVPHDATARGCVCSLSWRRARLMVLGPS